MNRFVKQLLLALVFVGQLAAVWALNRGTHASDVKPLDPEKALERHGFYLREGAQAAGLVFTHESPRNLDRRLEHILPIIASMGASVSVVDFDRDGQPDVF